MEYKLQKLTRKIIHYLHENKLALNYDKFQLIVIGKGKRTFPNIKLEIQGHTIHENTNCKMMGLILNNKLNWNDHIQNLKPQLRKTLMILKRPKNRVSDEDLRKLAIGIFFSKLQYGMTVYGCAKLNANDRLTRNTLCLQIITNKMMRIIKPGKSTVRQWGTERLCRNLNLLSINQMIIKL